MTIQKKTCGACLGMGHNDVTGICGFCLGSGSVYQSQPFVLTVIPRLELPARGAKLERHKNGSGVEEKEGDSQ